MPKVLMLALLSTLVVLSPADENRVSNELLVCLRGTGPAVGTPSSDLELLANWLGDARVIGLGESLHGVDDFHRLAHRIFAYLVEQRGFTVFALEVNQAHAARLDEFVQGQRDDLDALLAERWWVAAVFYDQALRDLLVWMRQYNRTAQHPIHFAGFDFKQPSFAMEAVIDGLRQLDPKAAAEAGKLYAKVLELGGFGVYPNVYGFSAILRLPLPPRTETKPLNLRLKVRGRGVSHGWVGLSIEPAKPGSDGPRASRYLSPDKLSEAWTSLDIETEVAPHLDEVQLVIFHRGNGTVWFDGLDLALDGQPLELAEELAGVDVQSLAMPLIQVMDYTASFDSQVSYAGGSALRVNCDPAVDEALRAARAVDSLLEATLAAKAGRASDSQAAWLRQMSRLALQATEYRTLVETNRDVFMAENATWLQQQGFPHGRMLALAHSSHTNRSARARGMGRILADEFGSTYRTATLLALAGQYRDFGNPRDLDRNSGLELFSMETEDVVPLGQRLGALCTADCMLHLQAAVESEAVRERLQLENLPVKDTADVAILIRSIHPARAP
jgi:erythromycin esterase-like protein